MKPKHIRIRIEQCLALAQASNCVRGKHAALLLDPERNVVLMDGYNGGPRGGGSLCGQRREESRLTGLRQDHEAIVPNDFCVRNDMGIESGTRLEIGCHHAEMNVICNAAAGGVPTKGTWLFVTGEPCLMCAKLIHHAGIERVLIIEGGYGAQNGVAYLKQHGVVVQPVSKKGDILP